MIGCPNPSAHKTRYRFAGVSADGATYYWESRKTIPGDSRIEEIRCPRDWFWGTRPAQRR